MSTPVIGDLIESTVGKVVDRLAGHYLPESMSEAEKEQFRQRARELSIEEARAATADTQNARALAGKEAEGAPGWTKVLTVTHRPAWSFLTLGIFSWTVLAPYFGFDTIPLSEVHKDVLQTVIVFYFGGRSIEKTVGYFKGGRSGGLT